MEITLEQLENLLNEQKRLCRAEFEDAWRESQIFADLLKLDPEEKVMQRIQEPRDRILSASYPSDFNVLKKYIV